MSEVEIMAKRITDYIDKIIKGNIGKSIINEVEFEFIPKDNSYLNPKFDEILKNHFNAINVSYSYRVNASNELIFHVILNDWKSDK